MDNFNKEQLIKNLIINQRYLKATLHLWDGSALNLEEMTILNLLAQLQSSLDTEKLTQETKSLAQETVNSSKKLVSWTKRLAIATFILAIATVTLAIAAFISIHSGQ